MSKLFFIALLIPSIAAFCQKHPSIMLTQKNVEEVRAGISKYPLLKSSYIDIKSYADKVLAYPISVPVPADGSLGGTHMQHKYNYKAVNACGIVYQITKDKRYADYVRDMLFAYAKVYNTWGRHPKSEEPPGGKIFWQSLNDCNWLVYMIQGYDCVYDYIGENDRKYLTDSLWTSVVNELSVINTYRFNRINNISTWHSVAVGMAGYVCGKKEWVEIALKGSGKDGKTGFFKQLDEMFSPDGYYEEGPDYQRYALLPFIIFARVIQQYQPEMKIYSYRNGLLKKAIQCNLQSTYTNKAFFPINDAAKDKTYETEELVYAVDIAYSDIEPTSDLLDIAQQQKRVIVSDAGMQVAKAIAEGKTRPFVYKSQFIKDGTDGTGGGIGILRSGNIENQTCAVIKAGRQGTGHGHFDRLNLLFYDNNAEVFSDYGLVISKKGVYARENETWAKATVAHNTLVVDKSSNYMQDVDEAEKYAPAMKYFEVNKNYQVVCAEENKAYSGVDMIRTVILFQLDSAESPVVVDVFKVKSAFLHQYDLPFWYQGQLNSISFQHQVNTAQLHTLGTQNGYQHIWLNAQGKVGKANGAITFVNNRKFYTTTFLADTMTRVEFVTLGANDPDFNLRNEKAYIITQPKSANYTFLSITEPHGSYNPITELTVDLKPAIHNIEMIDDQDNTTRFSFEYMKKKYTILLNYNRKKDFISIK